MIQNKELSFYDNDHLPSGELLKKILKFENSSFPYPWTLKQWDSFINSGHRFVLCVLNEINIDGLVLCTFDPSEGSTELLKIGVLETLRGTGTGWWIFKSCFNHLDINVNIKTIYLDVSTNNEKAIKFYENIGFKKVRLQKKFYSDHNDAYGMTLELTDSIKKSLLTE